MKSKPKPRARRRPGCKGRANRKRALCELAGFVERGSALEANLIEAKKGRLIGQKGNRVFARQRNRLIALLLFFWTATIGFTADARVRDAMPSEEAARWAGYLGDRFTEDQVIVKSLRTSEDRLYLNEEPFVLTHQTSIVDERGRRLRPGSIWVGWLVELCYRRGQKAEARAHGPEEKVLVRMRVLKRLLREDDDL